MRDDTPGFPEFRQFAIGRLARRARAAVTAALAACSAPAAADPARDLATSQRALAGVGVALTQCSADSIVRERVLSTLRSASGDLEVRLVLVEAQRDQAVEDAGYAEQAHTDIRAYCDVLESALDEAWPGWSLQDDDGMVCELPGSGS